MPAATLTIRDETATGQSVGETVIEFLTERVTVRELIRSRVYQEVQDYNRRQPETFRGLVQPTDAEQTLNGFRVRNHRQIDWKTSSTRPATHSSATGSSSSSTTASPTRWTRS